MNEKIILSVGMIVKNEEKYLEKCLSSLKPLLDAVSGELVIVDTGSTDKTVEIARRYTDKVRFFEWVNDFSAARNYGLSECVGEWFMFLDADDILDADLSDMIDFFKNPAENKKYNSAAYITRNYTQADGDAHSDLFVQRIARRTPELHFEGIIHEQLENMYLPTYYMNTFANHYGYMLESTDERSSKRKRNLDLLFKVVKDNPDDIRALCQIGDCISPRSLAEEYILKAVELSKKSTEPYSYVKPYASIIRYYSGIQPQKSLFYANEYINTAKTDEVHLIDAYAHKAMSLFRLRKYGEAADAALDYKRYYGKFHKGELDKGTMALGIVRYLDKSKYDYMTVVAAISRSKTGDFDGACDFLEDVCKLNDTEHIKSLSLLEFGGVMATFKQVVQGFTDFNRISKYYSKVWEIGDTDKTELFNAALEELYYKSEDKSPFTDGNAVRTSPEGFFGAMELISQGTPTALQEFVNGLNSAVGYSEAIYSGIKQGVDLSNLIEQLTWEGINQSLEIISENHADYAGWILHYCGQRGFTESIKSLYWELRALEKAVLSTAKGGLSKSEKARLYELFVGTAAIYVTNIHNPDLLNDTDIGVLPSLHRFGYHIAAAYKELEAGNKIGYIRALKEALRNYEDMSDVISVLLSDFVSGI